MTLGSVSTWMDDRRQTGKPSRYATSQPGQLSLAIHPWVDAMGRANIKWLLCPQLWVPPPVLWTAIEFENAANYMRDRMH